MTAFRLTNFSGMAPRRERQLLADNQAQIATNCRLTDGTLQSLRGLKSIASVTGLANAIKTIYRMTSSSGGDTWLAWDTDVDIAQAPLSGTIDQRIYYTGDSEPRATDLTLVGTPTPKPESAYVLGLPEPTAAPTVSASGGSGDATSRAYCYTFVSDWGEEGPPSDASDVTTGKVDDTWSLSGMDSGPSNTGTISAATESSGVVTVTVDKNMSLRVGEEVTITGVVGMTDLNDTFKVNSVVSSTEFTVKLTTSQTYTSGGTATRAGQFNITKMRIYRTISGVFRFVASITPATTYSDTATDTTVAGNEALPSTGWAQPPVTLSGLSVLASGSLVGFSGRTLYFSEPGFPHAWPEAYQKVVDYDIVAIGVIANTIVIATKGQPYLGLGSDPATLSIETVQEDWPCLSKRGLAVGDSSVEFPTIEGLATFSPAGNDITTRSLFTHVEWGDLKPDTFVAKRFAGTLYGAFTDDVSTRMFILQKYEQAAYSQANVAAIAFYADVVKKALYLVIGTEIYQWEGDIGKRLVYDWMGKEFHFLPPVNLGAARVDADFTMTPAEISAAKTAESDALDDVSDLFDTGDLNDALGDYEFGAHSFGSGDEEDVEVPPATYDQLQFQLWVDNEFKFAKTLTKSQAFKLPAGYKSDTCAIRMSGNVKTLNVLVAETMTELKTV